MSVNPMTWQGGVNPKIEMVSKAKSCMLPMGITSENVAAKFGVTRCDICNPAFPPQQSNGKARHDHTTRQQLSSIPLRHMYAAPAQRQPLAVPALLPVVVRSLQDTALQHVDDTVINSLNVQ